MLENYYFISVYIIICKKEKQNHVPIYELTRWMNISEIFIVNNAKSKHLVSRK